MSSPQYSLASLLIACAVAPAVAGCLAPWSSSSKSLSPTNTTPPNSDSSNASAPPRAVGQTAPPAPNAPSTPTEADMAGVLDKLREIGQMNPDAEQKLIEKLRKTDPKFWPATAEQFRASLAYHQELVTHDAIAHSDADPPPRPRQRDARSETALARRLKHDEPGPVPAPPYRVPSSSTPLGALVDPRRADADGISSEALAHATPFSQKLPLDATDTDVVHDEAVAPAKFESADRAISIGAVSRHPAADRSTSSTVVPAAFNSAESPADVVNPEKDVDKGWQQLVAEAADDLDHRVAESPSSTAEIHQHVSLRILRLLAGQTEAALEPIPHISPVEQDYWSRQIFALATYLDHHSQPDDQRRAAASVAHLDEAVANLRDLGALTLRNFAFCEKIYGYGAIEPYKEDRFSPGQQVSLYVEVENYHSQSTDKGFTTSLGSTYEILGEKGERVDGGEFPTVDDCCRSRRRDFHIQFGLNLPEKIVPGRYQLELVVRDRQSDKIAHATASFEIRGTIVSPPPKPSTTH